MGKRGKGRRRSKAGRRAVVVETAVDRINNNLALAGDACSLRGKVLFSSASVTAPTAVFVLAPVNMGVRAAAYAALFARYRFKQVSIKWNASNPTGGVFGGPGQGILGVLDDATVSEGDIPTTPGGVAEMRTSSSNFLGNSVPSEMLWKPTTKEWYYCYQGQTGSDQRFVNAGILYAAATVGATITMEITYQIVFKSAVDIGSS